MNINITPAKHCEEPYVGMTINFDYCTDDFDDEDMPVPHIGDVIPDMGIAMPGMRDMMPAECDDMSIANCAPETCLESWPIAMAYVPMQQFENLFEAQEGFNQGTIFRDLSLPFMGGQRR